MPTTADVYDVFVSSPSDVAEERRLLDKIVERINREERDSRVQFQLWKWEEDAERRIGKTPQDSIDEQLPDYDVYIGILGARFGTPTGDFGSGTEKEFRDALKRKKEGKQVEILFFFKTGFTAPRDAQGLDQLRLVLDFQKDLQSLGLYYEYSDISGSNGAFKELAESQLRRLLRKVGASPPTESPPVEPEAAGPKAAGPESVGPEPVEPKPVEPKPVEPEPVEPEPVEPEPVEPEPVEPEPPDPGIDLAAGDFEQFGYYQPNMALGERDQVIERTRRTVFDLITPAYLLDTSFHFLDWNTAFDEILAKPLKLDRQKHALEFIKKLENGAEVIERSKGLFGYDKANPIVDIEQLIFRSPDFGLITFRKIAAQTIDHHGNPLAWAVTLNVDHAEDEGGLWRRLSDRLTDDFNWTRYAVSYDQLLMPFEAYKNMLDRAVELIGDARKCVDLGAGSGNGTIRLLTGKPDRIVWAVDSNEAMLQYLRTKAHEKSKRDPSILGRLTTIKGNVERLAVMTKQRDYFDAALLINVLYAVEDPRACLKRAYELLQPAGVFVLTCAHRDTDVPKLFREMRRNLTKQNLFAQRKDAYDEAKRAHRQMDHLIHRNTLDELYAMIAEAGFDIVHKEPQYVDSVMLIVAEKREEF